mmetsp:Transcript_17381/g.29244  ORF Transcript_17381/g.29244 Transcript_17381/m.29244 type:complete len:82 (+) Transcript_17381:547-792(+)
MRDERKFQLKYRQSQHEFGDIKLETVMLNFSRILYTNFEARFRDKSQSILELMNLHTKFFDLIENLHDLFCRGSKDYKSAL